MKKISTTLGFILSFTILIGQTCGSFIKSPSTSFYDSIGYTRQLVFQDRFGNEYLQSDLFLENMQVYNSNSNTTPRFAYPYETTWTCPAGIFNLYFAKDHTGYGFSNAAYRQLICQVFKDMSRLLFDVNPSNPSRVNIWIASDSMFKVVNKSYPVGVNALASGILTFPNGINNAFIDNEVAKTIKTGVNSYIANPQTNGNNLIHGFLAVNFNNTPWSINYDSATIPANQFDLYTVVLHEVFHLLGMSSALNPNGTSRLNATKVYTLYDKFLIYGNDSSQRLLLSGQNNNISFNNIVSNISTGCKNTNSIKLFGVHLKGQEVYSPTSYSEGSSFSHLCCENGSNCSPYANNVNDYVTAFCGDMGSLYIKRKPNLFEVKLLCELGYQLKSIAGVFAYGENSANSTVYKTYSGCTTPINYCETTGVDDYRPSVRIGDSVVILYDTILKNDVNAGGIKNIHLADTNDGVLKIYVNRLVFYPSYRIQNPVARIKYFPVCGSDSIKGLVTFIHIGIDQSSSIQCHQDKDCNLVCKGDFEDESPMFNAGQYSPNIFWYLGKAIPNSNDLYKQCITGADTSLYWSAGVPECGGVSVQEPNKKLDKTGGQYCGAILLNTGPITKSSEAMAFRMKKTLEVGKQYRLRFLARKLSAQPFHSGFKVILVGDSLSQLYGSSLMNPAGVNAERLDRQNLIIQTYDTFWKTFIDTITPTRPINSIMIMNDSFMSRPQSQAHGTKVLYDNIEITELNNSRLSIQSEPDFEKPCIDENNTYSVRYTICADTTDMNADVTVRLKLPPQIIVRAGSSFNSSLLAVISKDSLKKGMCKTLLLRYTLNKNTTILGQTLNLECELVANNICYSTNNKSIATILPDYPPIQVTKTANSSFAKIGDTIVFKVNVCNTKADSIKKVKLSDPLPSNLQLINKGMFDLAGQTLSDSFKLYPAFSPGRPYCVERSYSAKVLNSCVVTNCAYASIDSMTCPYVSDCAEVYINTSNADSIYLSTRVVIDTVYHVKNYANTTTKELVFDNLQNRVFLRGIVVDSGYKLIIRNNSKIEFGADAIIEVEYSGILNVRNSSLSAIRSLDTCSSPHLWKGIRVFPWKSAHRYYIPGVSPLVWVWEPSTVIDSSEISQAEIAIKSGHYIFDIDAIPPIKQKISSLKMEVSNSRFIDNIESIHCALEFFKDGYAYIRNNEFKQLSANYIRPNTTMVNIDYFQNELMRPICPPLGFRQVRLSKNRFSTLADHSRWNTGLSIRVVDEGKNWVSGICGDSMVLDHSSFTNFQQGCHLSSSYEYVIQSDTFTNCQRGLDLNRFSILELDSSRFTDCIVGLSLQNFIHVPILENHPSFISNCQFLGVGDNSAVNSNLAAKAIYLNNVKRCDIRNNTIAQGIVNTGSNILSYTGVHLNKTSDVKVYENAFTNPSGAVNSVTAAAFFSENNATNTNAFSKNTVSANWHVGAWVWGENRNLRMRCNQFNTPANAAILVQGNLRDQGLPDGISPSDGCLKEYYPAANQFMWLPSHSSACGISPESAIKVDTAKSNFRFLYNTQSYAGINSSYPQTPDPNCKTSTYGDKEWLYNACKPPLAGAFFGQMTCDNGNIFNIKKPPHEDVPCEEIMPYIDTFQWRVTDFRGRLVGLIEGYHDFVHLADQQRIFHGLMKESKDIQVSIRRKCPDTLPILRDYLEESPFWEDRVELVEEVLRKRDFNAFATAKAKLDSFQIESIVYQGQNTLTKLLEDKGDLKYIYSKEKAMLQAETNGDTSFQLSESDLEQLFTIQSKQSYAGAVAERVLTKLLDTNFIHPLPSLLSNDTVPDINWEQYYNDYPVMIFPNPTEGHIRFEFNVPTPIETASIQIVKVSNPSTYVLVDDFTENFFSRVYDLSDKANGIYIMAIKVNGTIVTAKQFQIYK